MNTTVARLLTAAALAGIACGAYADDDATDAAKDRARPPEKSAMWGRRVPSTTQPSAMSAAHCPETTVTCA